MSILVTGGLGYIGSHTVVELVQFNYDQIIIVDNLQNTTKDVFDNIKTLCGSYEKKLVYIELDIVDKRALQVEVFDKYKIYAIIGGYIPHTPCSAPCGYRQQTSP